MQYIDSDASAVDREDMIANILRAYDAATPAERARGELWYARMTRIAQGHAARLGISAECVAGVWAAWSINNYWSRNIIAASRMLRGKPVRGLGMSRDKALACMAGEPLRVNDKNARKVLAFCANMAGDYSRVTVDRWALRVAYGMAEGGYVPKGSEYDSIEAAYVLAAEARGIAPAIMQAVTWIKVRA